MLIKRKSHLSSREMKQYKPTVNDSTRIGILFCTDVNKNMLLLLAEDTVHLLSLMDRLYIDFSEYSVFF